MEKPGAFYSCSFLQIMRLRGWEQVHGNHSKIRGHLHSGVPSRTKRALCMLERGTFYANL